MAASLQDSPLYGALFGDAALSARLDDAAVIGRMVDFERKLALVQGRLGVIPGDAGVAIDDGLAGVSVKPEALAAGVAATGVPVPALVAALRAELDAETGQWLHWGATSQDVIDTSQAMGWAEVLDVLDGRLGVVTGALVAKSHENAGIVMAARTRSQIATPITFGLRIAQWASPLLDAQSDLPALRRKALRVQFGGASGANTAIAPHGPAISEVLATELGLAPAPVWHTNRSGPLALANWLLSVANALDKMAGDLILMLRPEMGEVRTGSGGGSSTMPQKSNPVGAETIRVLAGLVRAAHSGLAGAMVQAEERDGAVWPLEWALLPQMLVAVGAALTHATNLIDGLSADQDRMADVLAQHSGVMAEQASFILAAQMPRPEAQALVKKAAAMNVPLPEALADLVPQVDWRSVLDPETVIAPCRTEMERILAER